MIIENPNRYRISTNFVLVKIGLFICLFSIVFNIIIDFKDNTFGFKTFAFILFGIALTAVYYYVSNLKRIDYDDIEQTLYVVNVKEQTEIEIPVEKIDKILFSAMGGRGNHSYVIVYRDVQNQTQKIRLFPILFDNSIETIKIDTEFKNPNVVIRNWSMGWNEFFD